MILNPNSFKLEYDTRDNLLYTDSKTYVKNFRKVSDMKPVLLDDDFVDEDNSSDVIYTMFRNSEDPSHREIFQEHGVRYDVTVMEHYNLGRESCKTFGHYHPVSEDGFNCYPEIYEVLSGKATFVLQKMGSNNTMDVILIDAKENSRVLMPPGYGHITVNRGKGKLILSNLVSSRFQSEYGEIAEKRGGAVYLIEEGSIMQNPNYYRISVNRYEAPEISWIDNNSSIYDQFMDSPDLFSFLNHPALLPH